MGRSSDAGKKNIATTRNGGSGIVKRCRACSDAHAQNAAVNRLSDFPVLDLEIGLNPLGGFRVGVEHFQPGSAGEKLPGFTVVLLMIGAEEEQRPRYRHAPN